MAEEEDERGESQRRSDCCRREDGNWCMANREADVRLRPRPRMRVVGRRKGISGWERWAVSKRKERGGGGSLAVGLGR